MRSGREPALVERSGPPSPDSAIVSAGDPGASAGGVPSPFVGIELREATGDESRVQPAEAEAIVSRETNLTGAHCPRVCGSARTGVSLPPGRACNPRSVAAIRVERGPERSGCFT